MKKRFNTESRLRFMEQEIKSGSYDRADEAVDWLMQNGTDDLFGQLLGKTFINRHGQLFVTPEFVVHCEKQPVVDYAFWNIISIASEKVLSQCGIDRANITNLYFRAYTHMPAAGIDYHTYSHDIYDGYKEEWEKVTALQRLPEYIWKFPNLKEI